MGWVKDIPAHSSRIYSSQHGQDGIIKFIFDSIGRTNKFFVEFGFNVTAYEPECGANTGALKMCEGWSGVLFDIENQNPDINLYREQITSENVVEIFKKYNVPTEVDYVSIDVDSIDLWIFKSIISSEYKPRVISVEFNGHFGIDEKVTLKNDPTIRWQNNDWVYGASIAALYEVGKQYGYVLVACETTLDTFFVRQDLVDEVPELKEFEKYCNSRWANEPTPERRALFDNL